MSIRKHGLAGISLRYGLFASSVAMLITLFSAMAQGEASGGKAMQLDELLPGQIDGWSAAGEDSIYDRNTIFDYMNGAGEIYLAFDFQKMLVREYTKESAPRIGAEIYLMASSEDAYGVFSHDTDGNPVSVGQGAIYGMGLLRLWKDSIFVRLLAESETDEAKAAVMALGRKIADAIPREGKKSALIDCLPPKGLLKGSIHYFHKQVLLNSLYYLADSNILNLTEKTEAVLARYKRDERKVRLLLVRYQKPKEAKAAHEQFVRIYFSDKPAAKSRMRIEKVERGEFVSARWINRFVILVFEAGDEKTCERLTSAVAKRFRKVFPWKKKAKKEG